MINSKIVDLNLIYDREKKLFIEAYVTYNNNGIISKKIINNNSDILRLINRFKKQKNIKSLSEARKDYKLIYTDNEKIVKVVRNKYKDVIIKKKEPVISLKRKNPYNGLNIKKSKLSPIKKVFMSIGTIAVCSMLVAGSYKVDVTAQGRNNISISKELLENDIEIIKHNKDIKINHTNNYQEIESNKKNNVISNTKTDDNIKSNELNNNIKYESNSSLNENNIEIINNKYEEDNIDTYVEGTKFRATSYSNQYTKEEFYKLACIVAGEDSGSYEGALAVISTMCNRADLGIYGGNDPLSVAMVPNQFTAYTGDDTISTSNSLYAKYMSGRSKIPDYVLQATSDALNGTRNTTAVSFRANDGKDRIQIGEGGNYYL